MPHKKGHVKNPWKNVGKSKSSSTTDTPPPKTSTTDAPTTKGAPKGAPYLKKQTEKRHRKLDKILNPSTK